MKTGNVNFNVVNEAYQVAEPATGILFLGGICKRGPINDPSTIITSPRQFRNIFGNTDISDDFPLLAMRALARGAKLRVNRITDGTAALAESPIIGSGSIVGAVAEITSITAVAWNAGNLDNKYFLISAGNGGPDFYVWFSGTDPAIPGRTGIKVAITANKTAAEVTTLVRAALILLEPPDGGAKLFTSVIQADTTVQLVTCTAAGICTNASAGNSGFTVSTPTPGVAGAAQVPQFGLIAKDKGADYNNLVATISDASNQNVDYFNLVLTLTNDALVSETYENLYIEGHPTIAESNYLSKLQINSNLVVPDYKDLSALTGQVRPTNGVYLFDSGSDGSAPDAADYIGSQVAGTGLYAWDPYYDSYAVAYPAVSASDMATLAAAGEAYAKLRKDLLYYQHLDNSNLSATALIAEKAANANINSPYIMLTAGGFYISDPVTGLKREISELADVLGNMAYVHNNMNIWSSFFGMTRGVIPGVLGVINNFGSPAMLTDLNQLALNQINMVINRSGLNMLWDDYTCQAAPSPENFACLMNLIFYIQKSLKPTLESFLGEPTDFTLLKSMYYEVKPFLDALVKGRALSSYEWEGDQFVTAFSGLSVNTAEDMQMGKVSINLKIITIAPLKEISVKIILTKAGVTFEV